jgi:hypothetical protein
MKASFYLKFFMRKKAQYYLDHANETIQEHFNKQPKYLCKYEKINAELYREFSDIEKSEVAYLRALDHSRKIYQDDHIMMEGIYNMIILSMLQKRTKEFVSKGQMYINKLETMLHQIFEGTDLTQNCFFASLY